MAKNNQICYMCGKSVNDVHKLIKGEYGYICDRCISIASDLLNDEEEEAIARNMKLATPSQIKAHLDRAVKATPYSGAFIESEVIPIVENITKIKFIKVSDRVYTVTDIDLSGMTITAVDKGVLDTSIPESEIFELPELEEFHIFLINQRQPAHIIDFVERKALRCQEHI